MKYQWIGAFSGLTAMVLFSFSTFHYMVIFWSFFAGVGLSMLYLRPDYEVPNLLSGSFNKQGENESAGALEGCTVCGKADCSREKRQKSLEILQPWSGISVTLREDKAVQDFFDTLLEKQVWKWYRNLSKEEEFINQLKVTLRHAISVLYRRINNVDLPEVIIKKLLRIAMEHLHICMCARDKGKSTQDDILTYYGPRLHTAARSRRQELDYLRGLSQVFLPLILPHQFMEGEIVKSFLRELLSSNVFLPGLDAITDPDKVNRLLSIYFDESPPDEATEKPAPQVPFLEKFAPTEIMQNESAMLQVELPEILQSQDMLYPFMTFLKSQGAVNILQFCLTVEDFNRRCLAPESTMEQKQKLHKEAKDIYETYFLPGSANFIHFDDEITIELGDIAKRSWKEVSSHQTSSPMFKAFEHAFNLLEQVYCPLFYHSDIFYQMICGSRSSAPDTQMESRNAQRQLLDQPKSGKINARLKGVINKAETGSLNGESYSDMDGEGETEDTDRKSLIDFDGEANGKQDILLSRDLSTWRVTVENVEQQRAEDGNDKYYVFIISIRRVNLQQDAELPPDWYVSRRYSEFYVLENKLSEFHGSLSPAHLPPKKLLGRNLEFLKSKCAEFERFLKALISKPVLRRSELLYDFLSPDHSGPSRFGSRVLPEVNLGRFFKRVPTKIIKEKGQHLDTLLQSLVNSCEPSKPKPGKYDAPTEDPVVVMDQKLQNDLYPESDWQMDPSEFSLAKKRSKPELPLEGVCDYILYLSKRIFNVENWIFHLMVALKTVVNNTVEPFVHNLVQKKIEKYKEEHHVVSLVNMFADILFNPSTPRTDQEKMERREQTFQEFKDFIPSHFAHIIGPENHRRGCEELFSLLQMPKLNKQLGYVLLDAFLLELFPELADRKPQQKAATM